MQIEKLDLKKQFSELYAPGKKAGLVVVPPLTYLMIDGEGEPGSEPFQIAVEALFSVSYKAKFAAKKMISFDYTVMPLEGLWWADDMNDFVAGVRSRWKWTLMIVQPQQVCDAKTAESAIAEITPSKGIVTGRLRLERFEEGRAAQILHVGPFSTEQQSISQIHELIRSNNGAFDGKVQKHHEIYLSDFRKTDPNRLRTIIRQPYIHP